jgi:ubiquinone/menaquinone biosynthesis C-methylase UbiE
MMGRSTKRNSGFRVVDLCCGVGFSTRALRDAFPQPDTTVIGIDTSPQMVAMAKFITDHIATLSVSAKKRYNSMKRQGHDVLHGKQTLNAKRGAATKKRLHQSIQYMLRNAEDTQLPKKSYDLVTVMYAFHEAPLQGRDKILKEARRLLSPGGVLAVVDISTSYTPSASMLLGEPYVQEYQRNIHRQLANVAGFERPKYKDIVPDHLGMWTLRRSASPA